jgi:hypothetical protein
MFGGGFGTAGVKVALLIIFCLLHLFMHGVFVVHKIPSFFILFACFSWFPPSISSVHS